MPKKKFDVVIIGGGPGGYVAAIRSAQLGLETALVERDHLGGICLNWGCIPTKALLQSSDLYYRMKHADAFGLSSSKVTFDLNKIVERSRSVAGQLNVGVNHLLKKNKITVIDGTARLVGGGRIRIEKDGQLDEKLAAPHIILATGARARQVPGLEPDGKCVWSYKEAMVPADLPKSLLVIGSGAIGIEFACFYNCLGTNVTVVEILPRILPTEDEEISAFIQKEFEGQGMHFLTGSSVTNLKTDDEQVIATVETDGKISELTFDRVISAVGVIPNTQGLGLEKAGVHLDDYGFIAIDEFGRTSAEGVYAVGDVAGPPCLAHKASQEGVICIEKIAGQSDVEPLNKSTIPNCTYSSPQVASIGLTEAQAKKRGHKVKVGNFPYAGNGKAIALGEENGLIKTIFDARTGEFLGAHMVGTEVTELINSYGIAITLEATEEEFTDVIFAHPTLSEMLHESVLDAYGHAIHI